MCRLLHISFADTHLHVICIYDGNTYRNDNCNFLKMRSCPIPSTNGEMKAVTRPAPLPRSDPARSQAVRGTRVHGQAFSSQQPQHWLHFYFASFENCRAFKACHWATSVLPSHFTEGLTEEQSLHAKPRRYGLRLGHPPTASAPSSQHPTPVTPLLETSSPSYRAPEAAGGVQVDLHVFRTQVSEGNPRSGPPSLLHLRHKSHRLTGERKATRQHSKAYGAEAELIERTDFLSSRWKILYQ